MVMKAASPGIPNAVVGTTTNSNAAAGNVGEFVTATVGAGSAVALTTATAANVTSISLTAGDWGVSAVVDHIPAATTSVTVLKAGISLATAAFAGQPGGSGLGTDPEVTRTSPGTIYGGLVSVPIPTVRLSIAATTTVYLVASATFTVSTAAVYGTIIARRIR